MRCLSVVGAAAIFVFGACNLDPDSSWFRDGDTVAAADGDTANDAVSDKDTVGGGDVPVVEENDGVVADDEPIISDSDTGWGNDESPVSDDDFVGTDSVIEKIQRGEVALDSTVSFEAVVTAVEYALDTQYQPIGIKGLFLSTPDLGTMLPWNGIYLYIKTPVGVEDYHVGDLLEVSGSYTEYYDASQVQNATISLLGTAAVPAPALIEDPSRIATQFESNGTEWLPTTNHGPDGEMWESCLIEVRDVEVVNQDLGHGQWAVTGGLVIDKKLYYYDGTRTVGTKFSRITGVLVYTYDAFKLAPRGADDVVPAE